MMHVCFVRNSGLHEWEDVVEKHRLCLQQAQGGSDIHPGVCLTGE